METELLNCCKLFLCLLDWLLAQGTITRAEYDELARLKLKVLENR